jgi:hypothetical protein
VVWSMTKDPHGSGSETDLITIRTFDDELQADLAKCALEAAGIDCMISRDDCGGMRPHLSMTQGIKIIVRAEDVELAGKVLSDEAQDLIQADLPSPNKD